MSSDSTPVVCAECKENYDSCFPRCPMCYTHTKKMKTEEVFDIEKLKLLDAEFRQSQKNLYDAKMKKIEYLRKFFLILWGVKYQGQWTKFFLSEEEAVNFRKTNRGSTSKTKPLRFGDIRECYIADLKV